MKKNNFKKKLIYRKSIRKKKNLQSSSIHLLKVIRVELDTGFTQKNPKRAYCSNANSFGSNCLLFAMLLDPHHSIQKKQISLINQYTDSKISQHTQKIFPYLNSISCEEKLVLIIEMAEMAASKLSFLSQQVKNFESVINMLIKEDKKFQLFEWSLLKLVNHKIKHIKNPKQTNWGTDEEDS